VDWVNNIKYESIIKISFSGALTNYSWNNYYFMRKKFEWIPIMPLKV